jgi:DNA-damage-inducible protein J
MSEKVDLHLRVDGRAKECARKVLERRGLSLSSAVDIFLHQVILRGELPFEAVPNEETLKALAECRESECLDCCDCAEEFFKRLKDD